MDCRKFRNNHVAFVDDLLPAFEMQAMERHLSVCSACAHHDTKIRRGLLLIRNLPPIEASPDFMARLNARLAQLPPEARQDFAGPRSHFPSVGSVAAVAAGLVAVAYMAVQTNRYFVPPAEPMVAMQNAASMMPEPQAPISKAALVASVPTGIPVWPTVLMVGQTPLRFASMEMSEADGAR
jgi:anti-sigma factor RsiW